MNEKKENVIVNGFFWRFAERCGVQLISAVVSILLARILTPDDYGKVALVTVFNNIMYVLLDCGIGTALVQKKEVDELDYSSAFFFSIVISFVLYGGMFVAAPYLAAFYNDPSMTPIFRGISLTVAVCGIKTIQQAHVTRNMKFQYFFYSAFAGAIVSTVLGLGLAYMGFGVWALVVQQVSNITVDTLVLWKLSSWRPKMEFSWQHLKGLLSYGWKLLASSLSSVIYNNLRSLIIGKMYTSADLAYYNQGDNLTYNIASSVDTSIESVLFPVMSSLQDDRAQVKNMTRRSIKTCTYIIAPVMMSIAFCAEPGAPDPHREVAALCAVPQGVLSGVCVLADHHGKHECSQGGGPQRSLPEMSAFERRGVHPSSAGNIPCQRRGHCIWYADHECCDPDPGCTAQQKADRLWLSGTDA